MPNARRRDPSTSVWALYAHRLRRERERAGLKQEDVAAHAQVSVQLHGHYENCRRVPTMDASKRFDVLFGLDEYFEGLQPLVVREAETASDLPEYTEAEAEAASIRIYQPMLIPGLFQTLAYARSVLLASEREDVAERAAATRIERQQILRRDEPPSVIAVLREAAIRELVGSPEIMCEQLGYLLGLKHEKHISIQVVPADAPVYVSGSIILLGYSEGGQVAYLESAGGMGRVVGGAPKVHQLGVEFDFVRSLAHTAADSERLIREVMAGLESR